MSNMEGNMEMIKSLPFESTSNNQKTNVNAELEEKILHTKDYRNIGQ